MHEMTKNNLLESNKDKSAPSGCVNERLNFDNPKELVHEEISHQHLMQEKCPICGLQFKVYKITNLQFTKSQNWDHVSWHFMDELREYVQTFSDPQQCNQCEYRSDKIDNLANHLAFEHSKLDELLLNEDLVTQKKCEKVPCEVKIPRVFVCGTCDKYEFSQSKLKSHECKFTKIVTSDNDLESHNIMLPDDSPNSFSDKTNVHEGSKERKMEENTETIDDSKENKPPNNVSINISQTQENDSQENDNLQLQNSRKMVSLVF